MKRLALLAVALVLAVPAWAASEYGSLEEAQALVKKAVAHFEKNGKDKALADFSKSPGPFVDRDLYVVVYDMNGTSLAHINPRMVGKNLMDMRDGDGRYMIKERVDSARAHPSGWQDIRFYNPVTKKIEPKRVYWERHGDLLFSSGAYKPE